ncbi:MAG: hypothetical protein KAW41_06450 [Candidatus Diapherotrites archaeon]|nr:hypothetical protein [Candidatus Diapherotrites archaeon]
MFAAVIILLGSLPSASIPNYDEVQAMKAAHDAGQEATGLPDGYTTDCAGEAIAKLEYYNATREVCMK